MGLTKNTSSPLAQRSGVLPKPPDPLFIMLRDFDLDQELSNGIKEMIEDLVSHMEETPLMEKMN